MIKVLLFAQIRETLNCSQLEIGTDTFDTAPITVAQLKTQLAERGDLWHLIFAEQDLLSAVNQVICDGDHPLKAGDEVAFFPPVTGG